MYILCKVDSLQRIRMSLNNWLCIMHDNWILRNEMALIMYSLHKVNAYRGGCVAVSICMFQLWNYWMDFSEIWYWVSTTGVWFLAGQDFSIHHNVQIGCGALLIQWVPGFFSSEVKRLVHEADHSPSSSTKVKNAWSYTSTPPYICMTCCLDKRQGQHTFTFHTKSCCFVCIDPV
jgi:hypothetical protein